MNKISLVIIVIVMFSTGAGASDLIAIEKIDSLPIIPAANPHSDLKYYPTPPGFTTDSPGIRVGETQYDMQSIGSTGRRIGLDIQGGVHFTWMKGIGDSFPPSQRSVYFNYVDNMDNWLVPEEGQNISQYNGDGFPQLSLTSDDHSGIAYDSPGTNYIVYAEDNFPGMGIFSYFDPPDTVERQSINPYVYINPYLTVDRNDFIHIVSGRNPESAGAPFAIAYTRSTDAGNTWTSLRSVDILTTPSYIVTSSKVSDKVAIVYTKPTDYSTQWKNDVIYIESEDGLTWNWRHDRINITEYGQNGDSLFAYTDIDAVYDYNDNLHIVWNALYVGERNIYYPVYLYHYGNDAVNLIAESDLPEMDCKVGAWNLPICKMSMSARQYNNYLYVVYTGFQSYDCSSEGYSNGDLYYQYSVDDGSSWTEPYNMTDSQSPGCEPGECDSDNWASISELVADNILRVVYINDKSPGAVPFNEGSITDNPVLFLEYFIWWLSGVDKTIFPESFSLAQNYPNPFNATTTIEFELFEDSEVRLAVYDITGALVEVLNDGYLESGKQSIAWNAEDLPSGAYFYRLATAEGSQIRKMVLLK
ncbi:MAG: T9SS type A sorting domain-containing protein [candidate division Zixibacteria bacterium]